jgi:glycosyltransferase involved in cell wall biosynthesis
MNKKGHPKVSLGIPVFNGENFIAYALDSLLAQTFQDIEIIISDNASTDNTEEICQQYAAMDSRIRYIRNKINLGASKNFNQLFETSRGEYFKWAAHDDLCAPEFLEQCVKILDNKSSYVLCYSKTKVVDDKGEILDDFSIPFKLDSPKAHERFLKCLCTPHPLVDIFGLIRSSVLKKTKLIGNFPSSDRVLEAELALFGPFYEVPEYLFFNRHHDRQHYMLYPTRRQKQAFYDPNRIRKFVYPQWRLLVEHLASIRRAPIKFYETVWSHIYMVFWVRKFWRHLVLNLILKEPKKPWQIAQYKRGIS